MSQRPRAQLVQDRADLLALLAEADGPMRLDAIAAAVQGLDIKTAPGYRWTAALRWTSTDLKALAKAGTVTGTHLTWPSGPAYVIAQYADSRWTLAEPGALTPAEQDADVADLRRQMAGWEPAPEVSC